MIFPYITVHYKRKIVESKSRYPPLRREHNRHVEEIDGFQCFFHGIRFNAGERVGTAR